MIRKLLFCLIVLCGILRTPLQAQDSDDVRVALERIAEAASSNAIELDLSYLELRTVPPEIGQLTGLQTLRLNEASLNTLPPEIGQLQNLERLQVLNNALFSLPEEIAQLRNLRELDIYGHQFTELPIAITQIISLETLRVSGNQRYDLQSLVIPPEIAYLAQLKQLVLSQNWMDTLPSEIGQLVRLEELDLSYNQLVTLPDTIGQLSQLKSLNLVSNDLNALPVTIGNLSNLCSLNLNQNELTHLPNAVGRLQSLLRADCAKAGLFINQNPLVSPPMDVQLKGTEAILSYLNNQARYHLLRLVVPTIASVVGLLALLMLLVRIRQRSTWKKKKV